MTKEDKAKKTETLKGLQFELSEMEKQKTAGEYYKDEPVTPHRVAALKKEIWGLQDELVNAGEGIDAVNPSSEEVAEDIKDVKAAETIVNETPVTEKKEIPNVQTVATSERDPKKKLSELQKEYNEMNEALTRGEYYKAEIVNKNRLRQLKLEIEIISGTISTEKKTETKKQKLRTVKNSVKKAVKKVPAKKSAKKPAPKRSVKKVTKTKSKKRK